MRRFDNQMPLSINNSSFFLRFAAPLDENKVLAVTIKLCDRGISELFPSLALMNAGLPFLDR